MKLFVSYSHDDKAWVNELCRNLREDTDHLIWFDERIVIAADWWDSILENIESADCFVFVMSPKAIESIYCIAELKYAIELNKPVLPLMLKSCSQPEILEKRRTQFKEISANILLDKVILKIEQGLNKVDLKLAQGSFQINQLVHRPPEPKPIVDCVETMEYAEDAAENQNYTLAIKLFEKIIENDNGVLGEVARSRLTDVEFEYKRSKDYNTLKSLAQNPKTFKAAQSGWKMFVERYGEEFDPPNLALTPHSVTVHFFDGYDTDFLSLFSGNASSEKIVNLTFLKFQNGEPDIAVIFSQLGIATLTRAREEAEKHYHSEIGTEHILLGLLRDEIGLGGKILRALGLNYELLSEKMVSPSYSVNSHLELSSHIRNVLQIALDEAHSTSNQAVGTRHILLGLVRYPNGIGSEILREFEISLAKVQTQIIHIFGVSSDDIID